MNSFGVRFLTDWLGRRPHILLLGHLVILHALAFGGWRVATLKLLWPVAVGLLLLWQPFVEGKRRFPAEQGALLLATVLIFSWWMNPWLLLVWCGALAAAIGGRVFWSVGRRERLGYLASFGFVVGIIVLGVVPETAPGAVSLEPLTSDGVRYFLALLLPGLIFFPAQARRRKAEDAFDFFYALLVFLLLAVFVLGSLAFMLIARVAYLEAVFRTSLALAAALLVMGWVWDPRAGFSGVGSAFARYLLTIGMPLEQWLVVLNEESERESDPERFLGATMQRMGSLPWVVGGTWSVAGVHGEFGEKAPHAHTLHRGELTLTLCFRHAPSPAMRWHFEWLLRLAAEHFVLKQQARELQRIGYLEAVYETGARVTHDVKNLLQSMQGLCFAAANSDDPEALARLLQRQLPQISERLKMTLDKLQRPEINAGRQLSAALWWAELRQRYAADVVLWEAGDLSGSVPADLFDSVAENLLQNALAKTRREAGVEVKVIFSSAGESRLAVEDSGLAVPDEIAQNLFRNPVVSEDGLGIGLYHAARQADGMAYRLWLERNRPGKVRFALAPLNPSAR